jgi:hypothetical protein
VLHGGLDRMVAAFPAERTTALVPGATLELFGVLGHVSIETQVVPAPEPLLRRGGQRERVSPAVAVDLVLEWPPGA